MTEEYRKKKILIVDDTKEDLEETAKLIENYGYKSINVSSADSAITQIQRGLEYNLLIVDDWMYAKGIEHHGGELVARVSKRKNPKIPVIMTTRTVPWQKENVDVIIYKSSEAYTESLVDNLIRYLPPQSEE